MSFTSTVNSSHGDGPYCVSADGLELYFSSNPSGGEGNWDLWVTTRPTTSEPWGAPVNLGPPVNTSDWDAAPYISADGLSLFFCHSTQPGGQGNRDVWVTTRATISDPWGIPVNLGPPVNTSYYDDVPWLSADGLSLYFTSNWPGGHGGYDVWVTTRATISDPWGTPVNLGPPVNSSSLDYLGDLSADGSTLYFTSDRPGGVGSYDTWQVPIIPIVDFNGDGIVDLGDLVILIDNWGLNEPLCDIGPMPWGDGVVGIEDLKVFIKYWEQENMPENSEDNVKQRYINYTL